jgi:hypothetical protein
MMGPSAFCRDPRAGNKGKWPVAHVADQIPDFLRDARRAIRLGGSPVPIEPEILFDANR